MPKRIQRQRTKGWRMPKGAVYVGRPTRWGNPYRIEKGLGGTAVMRDDFPSIGYLLVQAETKAEARAIAVAEFEREMAGEDPPVNPLYVQASLAGRDLVCWCPLDDGRGNRVPCHADVLLRIANAPDVLTPSGPVGTGEDDKEQTDHVRR